MAEFTKTELEKILIDTQEHLAETKRLGPGYYGIRGRYDYAVESDERYIEKLRKQITEYDQAALNENQQIVLEWLKEAHKIGWHVLELFDTLLNRNYIGFDEKEHSKMDKIRTAILALNEAEMFQVLAAFAEWGLSIEKGDQNT